MNPMLWQDVAKTGTTDSWGVTLQFGPVSIIVLVLCWLAYIIYRWKFKTDKDDWAVVEGEIPFGGGKLTIKPNYEDIQIAHKAWVELASRKAGLPFDDENDVIVEVYNSWYELFREMRALAKQVPADKIRRCRSTRELVNLLITALNSGLRPHLTTWQAKFRSWYEAELKNSLGMPPQVIQRKYDKYPELVKDLRQANEKLVKYMELLRTIAQGRAS